MIRAAGFGGVALVMGAMLLAIGCGDSGQTAAASSAAPLKTNPTQQAVVTARPLGSAAPAATVASNDVSTEADFEEEADAQIDASNMDAELSALDKEINEDK